MCWRLGHQVGSARKRKGGPACGLAELLGAYHLIAPDWRDFRLRHSPPSVAGLATFPAPPPGFLAACIVPSSSVGLGISKYHLWSSHATKRTHSIGRRLVTTSTKNGGTSPRQHDTIQRSCNCRISAAHNLQIISV